MRSRVIEPRVGKTDRVEDRPQVAQHLRAPRFQMGSRSIVEDDPAAVWIFRLMHHLPLRD